MIMHTRPQRASRRQAGVALIVAMILLVVATLLGLSGIQGTTLQERMSGNMFDRALAMQVSEGALRAAEAAISANPNTGVDCRPTSTTTCPVTPTNTFTVPNNESTNNEWTNVTGAFLTNTGIAAGTPQYHIQILGETADDDPTGINRSANVAQYGGGGGIPTARHYRITARSHVPSDAASSRAIVVLSVTVKRAI